MSILTSDIVVHYTCHANPLYCCLVVSNVCSALDLQAMAHCEQRRALVAAGGGAGLQGAGGAAGEVSLLSPGLYTVQYRTVQ